MPRVVEKEIVQDDGSVVKRLGSRMVPNKTRQHDEGMKHTQQSSMVWLHSVLLCFYRPNIHFALKTDNGS